MKKKLIWISSSIGVVLVILLVIVLINSYIMGSIKLEDKFIAHAGGEIDGVTYTNCLEAVEQSIERGCKYIELDLLLTSDSMIIAVHDWPRFNSLTGFETMGDSVPSYEQVMSRKINGWEVLDAKGIVDLFKKNPGVIFVTDIIDDVELLDRNFSDIKNQMMVEAFSADAYFELKNRGFTPMLFSMSRYVNGWLLSPSNWGKGGVDWITTHHSSYQNYTLVL